MSVVEGEIAENRTGILESELAILKERTNSRTKSKIVNVY